MFIQRPKHQTQTPKTVAPEKGFYFPSQIMDGITVDSKVLQYVPFKSLVHQSFWYKFVEIKLNVDRLSDSPRRIHGYYSTQDAGCTLELDYSAFNSDFKPPKNYFAAVGILYNKNTVEEFRSCDKNALLAAEGEWLAKGILDGSVLDNPSLLFRFLILSFADLKRHTFYYWVAFPAPVEPVVRIPDCFLPQRVEEPEEFRYLRAVYDKLTYNQKLFFILEKGSSKQFKYIDLKNGLDICSGGTFVLPSYLFCFSDFARNENPSWLLRTYIYLLYKKCERLQGQFIDFIGFRINSGALFECIHWKLKIPNEQFERPLKVVGWEPNANGKMSPQCVRLAELMNSQNLAESAINLNLKLMKWRALPKLDIDKLTTTKCLLFGAGTLGCAVARNLLGWGFKYVSFIDNGQISYSNPARQSLYVHADALNMRKMKATTAAMRLKEINPNVVAQGFCVQVPMPGHTVSSAMEENVANAVDIILTQIKENDVIFLLTDSRESRWLPTLLGAFYKKTVINAALGFDTYMVMRHGSRKIIDESYQFEKIPNLCFIAGSDLGCYFCSDVTAPGNSTKDRTLDQQCTVTRPGVATIAASYAVELLVSLLQHKYEDLAPAYFCPKPASDVELPQELLGIIPHSIRGSVDTFDNILPACNKFAQCVACSEKVLTEFGKRGKEFLFQVFQSSKYLEDFTGVSKLSDCSKEVLELSSDEDFI